MLNKHNFNDWIEHVKDDIESLDHKGAPDMWKAYTWDRLSTAKQRAMAGVDSDDEDEDEELEDPAHHKYDELGSSTSHRLQRLMHNHAWKKIRLHLSEEMFRKVQSFAPKNVPLLLVIT